ncbi:hypothetical protein D3C86_2177700 [compost metagenome]
MMFPTHAMKTSTKKMRIRTEPRIVTMLMRQRPMMLKMQATEKRNNETATS